MVSKSFCVIHCHCGKETTTRRDVDNDRGWENNIRIFQCNHLAVDADMYTFSTFVPWGPSDEVRFRIQGKCFCNKRCAENPCLTTSADSNRTSFSNGDDRGTLDCSHCGSRYDWVVSHRPHNFLQAVSLGTLGYASGSSSGTIMPFVNAAKKTFAEKNITFDLL